jgi:mono/diheme cytochrome c family protein
VKAFIIAVLFIAGLNAEEAATFAQVEPIFADRCYSCHGPEKQKDKLRLDSREAIEKGSKHGPVIKAGEPENSKVYERITLAPDHEDIMPAKGDALTAEQIKIIGDWIKAGAKFE